MCRVHVPATDTPKWLWSCFTLTGSDNIAISIENLDCYDIVNNQPQTISCPLWFRLASYRARPPCHYQYKWSASEWHLYRLSDSTANNRPLGPRHRTMAGLWYDSSRFLLHGGECCVCSISPSSLLCPTCVSGWNRPTLTAAVITHQRQYPRRLVSPLGCAVACLTTP